MAGVAVVDTGPIIALVASGELRILEKLFSQVVVPLDVWAELVHKPGAPEPAALLALSNLRVEPTLSPPPIEAAALDAGERAVIVAAATHPGCVVLLDEKRGRRVATTLGITVYGTISVLLEAKRRTLVPAIAPILRKMVDNGYHLAPELVRAAVSAAGETT